MTIKGEGTVRASLELLYNVSREFAAALDLRTVLKRVVVLSLNSVGATSGSIIVLDDAGKPVESVIIADGQVLNGTTKRLRITLDKGLAGWVVRNRQAALIDDTSQDTRWWPSPYAPKDFNGPKSAVSAPILVRDRLVGVVTLSHNNPGAFTQDHLDLVQAIADQAGISILNARLYSESQRQAQVMTALVESATAITASLDLDDVLLGILKQVTRALEVQCASIALIDTQINRLVFQASLGWDSPEGSKSQINLGQGISGWTAKEGKAVIIQDAPRDPRYDGEIEERIGGPVSGIAAAPIQYGGEVIGVMEAINPRDGIFEPDALLFMTGISSLAGTAIRNAQLFSRLQAAHKRYRDFFEDSIEPILITTLDGKIVEANRQAVQNSRYERDALIGKDINSLHPVDFTKTGQNYEKIGADTVLTYESTLDTRSGSIMPIDVHVRQVKIYERPFLQWTLQDISERKSLDSLRTDLTAMVFHDLQSPLANVVSSLDVAGTLLPEGDESLESLIGIAVRSTQRIQRLIASLLDINMLEMGQQVGVRVPVDPTCLIKEAVETVEPMVSGKHQEIKFQNTADLPQVLADADMIRRVLINLLENAAKYTPSNLTIDIGATVEENFVRFSIRDHGTGIAENDRQRIFDKFVRLSPGRSYKGMGLGLAFCRLAIDAHGGHIWVENAPEGGAEFLFTLPLASQPTESS